MLELSIDGQIVDLVGGEDIAIDYAIFSFDDIESRKGLRSYSFKIPLTTNNRAIFEVPDEITNLSELPYTRQNARLYSDGVDLGVRFIEVESVDEYINVRLYGSNTSFYSFIKGRKIEDLSNCDKDHFWTFDNVVNSRSNTSGYIYPLINYFKSVPNSFIDNVSREVAANHLYPALFLEEVIQQIIEEAGYEYNNLDPAPQTLILPCSGQLRRKIRSDLYNSVHTQTGTLPIQQPVNGISSKSYYLTFNETTGGCATYWDGVLADYRADTGGFLLFANPVSLRLSWSVTLTNTTGSTISGNLAFTTNNNTEIDVDPAIRTSQNYYEEAFALLAGETKTFTGSHDFVTGNAGTFEQNYIASWIEIGAGAGSYVELEPDSYIEVSEARSLDYDDQVLFTDSSVILSPTNYISFGSLFDYLQSEVLINYCRLLGLIITVDDINKVVTLQKFDRVSDNITQAIDWSNKLDLSFTPAVTFFSNGMAQNNRFVFQVDDPEAQAVGTNGSIEVSNTNLPLEADMVAMDWASCDSVELLDGLPIPTIPCVDPDTGVYSGVNTQRVLYLERKDAADLDTTGDLTYIGITGSPLTSDTVSDDLPLAWFIDPEKDNNLGFNNSLISERYESIGGIYSKFKAVEAYFRLNESDINKLSHTTPVYVKRFNAYFYIDSITGYTPGANESTKVKLVKIF